VPTLVNCDCRSEYAPCKSVHLARSSSTVMSACVNCSWHTFNWSRNSSASRHLWLNFSFASVKSASALSLHSASFSFSLCGYGNKNNDYYSYFPLKCIEIFTEAMKYVVVSYTSISAARHT
jgi:hypothetical protein